MKQVIVNGWVVAMSIAQKIKLTQKSPKSARNRFGGSD
jgi:hypothetical protein